MKKILVGSVLGLGVLASNAFALTSTDFDTGTAISDLGLAVVAVLGVVVIVFGYKRVVGMFK